MDSCNKFYLNDYLQYVFNDIELRGGEREEEEKLAPHFLFHSNRTPLATILT
jgi:hypothetical protein